MIETKIRDYLISNVENLSTTNCFIGNVPSGNTVETFAVVTTKASPLSDSHNTLAAKLTAPKGINQKSLALSVYAESAVYDDACGLIWDIFSSLGGEDGGCIVQDTTQMYITPVESPYHEEENTFRFNFIVRTNLV